MFSAYSLRSVVIGTVALHGYNSAMPGHNIRSYPLVLNRESSDRSYSLIYLMIILGFILFMLLMVPSIIEPPVLYIGVIFSLLSIIFIIAFMNSYLKHKTGDTSVERSDQTDGRLSAESQHFSDTLDNRVSDGQTYNGSQLSMVSNDLPPKYELPPSYSQITYSINI